MTRPIFLPMPVHNSLGQVISQSMKFIGFDYKSEHANRHTPSRYRRRTAGTSPRRFFRTVALRP